ncbi:MAG: amidase family protein [Alphaproteobacteria bacterium]|jgi:amidase
MNTTADNPVYWTARRMIKQLQARRISARELLDAHMAQQERLASKINAVIAADLERAHRDAIALDDARTTGKDVGVLAGVPITVKDGFNVERMPASAGNPALAGRDKNCGDAELVQRARRAGAVVWGKTNVPFMLGDWQTYNAIYGTTNNPYDTSRGPAGSSGGAAAALASGITPLEIGSDIGGSLRIPASFCGVCSLKPTWGVLPMRGHVPPPPQDFYEWDLGVGGPMARNVGDLRLFWNVLSGEASTRKSMRGLRVAVWDSDPNFPLARDVREGVARAAAALEQQGAAVTHIQSPLDTRTLLITYRWILASLLGSGFPEEMRQAIEANREMDRRAVGTDPDPWSAAFNRLCCTARFHEVAKAYADRQRMDDRMAGFFEQYDAILMPVSPVAPFPHDHSEPFFARQLEVDGKPVSYMTMLAWIALATLLRLPAVAFPAGLSAAGLPIGVQLVAPPHAEVRLFDLAAAAEEVLGGFVPPPL